MAHDPLKRNPFQPTTMATLDNCPPEICHRIYQFACTDDGTTGRTLSLVSKYIHDSSKPYKLQSISIYGPDKTRRFLLALQRTPEQYRRVSYLSIVNYLIDTVELFSSLSLATSPSAIALFKQGVDPNMQTDPPRDEALFIVLLQILHMTSATLQTLYLKFPSVRNAFPLPLDVGISACRICSMPLLRELTVHGDGQFIKVDKSLIWDDEVLWLGLRYLDLACLGIPWEPFDLYKWISKFAPALTHLRLPTWIAVSLYNARWLGLVGSAHTSIASASTTQKSSFISKTLQRIYIHSCPPQYFCSNTTEQQRAQAQEEYTSTMDNLRAVEHRGGRVVLLHKRMQDWRMEDIVEWDREEGMDET